ncbi:unnamed protein product [Cyclocybe aegerita]|uniref:Uncharacterized protein n=1 Tax=Cyclocybe aegerita TaxID=1973307 RepID=A0A8S0WB96_CYCAE|nr:unnamed protein product [Cyclocybe aegerita]
MSFQRRRVSPTRDLEDLNVTHEGHPRDRVDLLESILNQQRAVELPTPTQLSQQPSYIENAITYKEKVILFLPETPPKLSSHLSNPAMLFTSRFKKFADIEDVDRATPRRQRAAKCIPEGHPDLPNLLSEFGCSFATRFQLFREPNDIKSAISNHERSSSRSQDTLASTNDSPTSGQRITRFNV